jgi:hypothetical protein
LTQTNGASRRRLRVREGSWEEVSNEETTAETIETDKKTNWEEYLQNIDTTSSIFQFAKADDIDKAKQGLLRDGFSFQSNTESSENNLNSKKNKRSKGRKLPAIIPNPSSESFSSTTAPILVHPAAANVIAVNDPTTVTTIFSLLNTTSGSFDAGLNYNDAPSFAGGGALPGTVDGPMVIYSAVVVGAIRVRAIQYSLTPCIPFGNLLSQIPSSTPCVDESNIISPSIDWGSRGQQPMLPQNDLIGSPDVGNWVDLDSANLLARRNTFDIIRPPNFDPLPSAALVAQGLAPPFASQATRSFIVDMTLYVPSTATLAAARLYAYTATAGPYVTDVLIRTMRSPSAAYVPSSVFLALTALQIILHVSLIIRAVIPSNICVSYSRKEYLVQHPFLRQIFIMMYNFFNFILQITSSLVELPAAVAASSDVSAKPGELSSRHGWLLFELICATLLIAVLAIQSSLLVQIKNLNLDLHASSVFVPAWNVFGIWTSLRDLIAVVTFLLCLRFLSVLGVLPFVGPQLTALLRTLSSGKVLMSVGVVLAITVIAGLSHSIAFGSETYNFSIFTQSFLSTFTVSFGSDVSNYAVCLNLFILFRICYLMTEFLNFFFLFLK